MKLTKIYCRILGGIVVLLLINLNYVLADDTIPGQTSNANDSPMVASILQKHISDLNNQSKIHLNQGDKEKFVQMTMLFNYLVVMIIASLIVIRTRVVRPRAKRVLRLRH